ncbi:uncharacterized protein Z520_02738 [Fonsecaea multimorphosa CBS 102226]|uniref:DUF7924 domain-containing protein n=1 Tax=Fonsecaea multimorphosa CBS 102226 TaxID=1442371 RepID=A0A0D2HGX7_9EURO|nr:uncharacterized protein Z520_02738 [Fonsecaea multimorphosa CBS 102226]KIY01186.1 hypothetical protein Z520_02738 [Fonsecaea multimorphosa CBS 102226]OAL28798.1 hypothetical protein AYO22_02663 [Fonsecaea multimorphosa]
MSATSGLSAPSPEDDLPPSSYDGSHLPWKTFRQQVLAQHRIRVLESAPKEKLPTELLGTIESELVNAVKYEPQKEQFRDQVINGRGFGPSPLFPPNLLPPIDDEPRLARCMVPAFSREALPERAINQIGPLYELSVPRSGLGCGFAASALTGEELAVLPSWLVTTGTIVHFDTGYISPGAALYCPFLVFERTWGNKENRLEAANNQCAIGGAWCVRALQMLYAKAWKGEMMPELPIAFSCSIDNTFAVLNMHWIDHGQVYCMSPLCKFDLSKDDHFSSFLVWIDSIGKWGVSHLLPVVKSALERLRAKEDTPPPTPRAARLTLDTACPNDLLIRSLKQTFENIPWRFEDDEFTPVSSSTASWGSPMVTDLTFANLNYPSVPAARPHGGTPTSAVQRKQFIANWSQYPSPPPAYTQNSELVWQKRLNHAMDEIHDLQRQIQVLRNDFSTSTTSCQSELSDVKSTMTSVLRKENLTLRNRSLSLGVQETWSMQNFPRSPLVNEVLPEFVVDKTSIPPRNRTFHPPPSPKLLPQSLQSHGPPSPGLPSPGMPSPTFSIYSETTNIVTIPPAPPRSASLFKFATLMVSGHMASMFIPNILLRVFVLGCITDVCILAFASPHLPSSAEYLLSFLRSR